MTEAEGRGIDPDRRRLARDLPREIEAYFLALLYKGPRWDVVEGEEDIAPRQLAFLRAQIEAGRYLLAGPITGPGDLVGLSIIAAGTAAEALALASSDPGVHSGRLRVEIHPALLPSLRTLQVRFNARFN